MSRLPCRLLYRSDSEHLQQLYTGFLLLHRSGCIRLTQQFRAEPVEYGNDAPHLRAAGHAHLDALLDGGIRVHFDTHDSQEIALGELDRCDVYFKRSYSRAVVETLGANDRHKMRPLGLNYRVLPDTMDVFALRRSLRVHGLFARSYAPLRQALLPGDPLEEARLSRMHAKPDFSSECKVVFFAAAYDPHDNPQRTPDKIRERILINDTRARIISVLKDALGDRFVGGFCASPFARERYPELTASAAATAKQSYLSTMRSYPIGVATTGLHQSIGWKLAEYVAFSKAPLSEKLNFEVPGDFASGKHYLQFSSAESCLQGAVRLLEDAAQRHELMRNNALYYEQYLQPEALVRNALTTTLQAR